ncbi:hypothetical protein ACFVYJ_03280 [Pontibacter sp. JAM-7]|uniref:hypothetical protein n=1 Tax=Pontibacter sp. JAM-7 TaxID=3366581 RepID=UPI003AF5627E
MNRLGVGGCWLLVCGQLLAADNTAVDAPIPYEVMRSGTASQTWESGESVYDALGREGFDREPMVEIPPRDNPSNLPQPSVILYSETETVLVDFDAAMTNSGQTKASTKPPRAEDRVYNQIQEADRRGRCFLLGKGCEFLAQPPQPDAAD